MNIYQKLNEIHKQVGYIKKGQRGKQYQYVGSSDVLAVVRSHMNEQGVLLLPSIKNAKVSDFYTKTETLQLFTEIDMTMTWVNADNPDEKIELDWYAQGMDLAGEKGVGKALTYAEKYFLLKFFNIATDDMDPDAFQDKVESSKPQEKINNEQVGLIKSNVLKVAKGRNKTEADVYKALKITDITKLTKKQAEALIEKTNKWVEQL